MAQKSSAVIVMDSPEQAFDGVLALEGSAQGALKKAFATLEDQAPAGGSLDVKQVLGVAPSKAAADRAFLARLVIVGPNRARMVNIMVLSS